MESWFFILFIGLIGTELVKGLSANGTPPFLQKFSWQMDLAYFMWSNITIFRSLLVFALLYIATQMSPENHGAFTLGLTICLLLWGGIYWLFNHYWVGRVKFLPITQKTFVGASENQLDLDLPVIGVDLNGQQKAYPANLLFYHHQLSDEVGGKPILATYCGMCRSGRVYDVDWPEGRPEFMLVGAVSFNAVLRDSITNSWWRQETGEAAKGLKKGDQLPDVYFEQMALKDWLAKYPDSLILQYDPAFLPKYNFFAKLLEFEAELPRWHRQETPPLVIGVEVAGAAKAYDLIELHRNRFVNDEIGNQPVLATSDPEGRAGFVYDRRLEGQLLAFEMQDGVMTDKASQSSWDHLGRCYKGPLAGKTLTTIQSYQQFIRAWITFHPDTDFYRF